MSIKLNERIAAVLPDLMESIQKNGDSVVVGGVAISRSEAQNMCSQFENYINSGKDIEWNVIPLALATANVNYRCIQQELNRQFAIDDER